MFETAVHDLRVAQGRRTRPTAAIVDSRTVHRWRNQYGGVKSSDEFMAHDGLTPEPGLVLCDYFWSFNYRERSIEFLKKAPAELIDDITNKVLDLLDPTFS